MSVPLNFHSLPEKLYQKPDRIKGRTPNIYVLGRNLEYYIKIASCSTEFFFVHGR